jgi:hypothetical protein
VNATLSLPTGRLIAADPAALYGDARPLEPRLDPRDYPVRGLPVGGAGGGSDGAGPDGDGSSGDESSGDGSSGGGSSGDPDRADGHARVEIAVAGEEPERWERRPGFATPSGRLALLDAAALEGFTELGDEPVDEYELLQERVADSGGSPVAYEGLLVLPFGPAVCAISFGYGRSGRLVRIVFEGRADAAQVPIV